MRDLAKPLRTLLYVPGNKEEWILKAPKYGSDALILDLEDSVPLTEKSLAREVVSRLVPILAEQNITVFVRVNDPSTGLTQDDIAHCVVDGLYGITLPMVKQVSDVESVDALIGMEEENKGIPLGTVLIDPGLETASGIRSAYDIAVSSKRVAHMGASGGRGGDVARSIGYRWSPQGNETLFIRSKVLLDSRAAGVPYPVTGLWQDIHDHDGLRSFAKHSRDLGYTGMSVIHPSHIEIVNQVFSPTHQEIAEWMGIIEAMDGVRKMGGAAVQFNGAMVDIAHEKTARDMLSFSKALGLLD